MFRALPCSSSGGLRRNCIYEASGIVTLCRWLSCAPVKKESRFFFFVYRHSDLEVSCSNGTKTRDGESRCCLRAVAGHEIWHWVGRCETFHSFSSLTTGPKPLPKRALHIVRSRASSFKWEHPLLSVRSSNSFLRLLPCLPVTSIPPCIFETFTERNCWAYDACAGEVWSEGGFTLALFQGWVVGSEVAYTAW